MARQAIRCKHDISPKSLCRKCRNEYDKKYRAENREKRIKYAKKYYREHKELWKKWWKEYYKKHKEATNVRSSKWIKNNPEKRRKINMKQHKKHRETIHNLKNEIWGNKCRLCGSTKRLVVHEIHGRKHGRLDSYKKIKEVNANDFIRLCNSCHTHITMLSQSCNDCQLLCKLLQLMRG